MDTIKESDEENIWSDEDLYKNMTPEKQLVNSRDIISPEKELTTSETQPVNPISYEQEDKTHEKQPENSKDDFSPEKDTDSTDSENVPLADLSKKRKQPVKRKLIQSVSDSECEYDDTDDDKTYVPSKEDFNSSDSECRATFINKKKKQRKIMLQPSKVRQQAWKKKLKTIKVKKNDKGKSNVDVAKKLKEKILMLQNKRKKRLFADVTDQTRAKKISKHLQTIHTLVKKSHLSRLDSLLACNELRRIKVYGDGNCFFASVQKSANIAETATEIRMNVCNHMITNADKYLSFCARKDAFHREEFLNEVDMLKADGAWNLDIADIVPLAVANYYASTVRIYSSSISTPVIDVKADQITDKMINLAYISIRGHEHYDGTKIITNETDDCCNESESSTRVEISNNNKTEFTAKRINQEEQECDDTNIITTPHKRARYISPKKILSSRKKKRNPDQWKRNIRKSLKTEGKEYVSVSGKIVQARRVNVCNCKCRYKCNETFTQEQRQDIFRLYYELGSFERQRQFLCEMVERGPPNRTGKGKKSYTQQFFLAHNDKKERVCRDFFIKTLDVKRKTIDYTLAHKKHGVYGRRDMRGKRSSGNKLDFDTVKLIKQHIESFPKMESHYARKNSKKQYLSHDLNIKKMWKLYTIECEKKELNPVKQHMYRKIFCENYNLSFYKPKKDQCSLCTLYNRRKAAGTIDDALKEEYIEHQKQKESAREEKAKDKARAKNDTCVYVACFDLEAVLTTPCSLVSELYYSRKLCCYNLTVYSLGDKTVVCHVWDETNCKRGACEIATCLLKNTLSVCRSGNVKEVIYFSDSCGGQNRNQFVTASLLFTLSQVPNLRLISHKFLVSGHSQMECDSVHSTIEGAKKITPVYVPSQWCTLISLARKSQPYIAVPMKYNHVIDFKDFVKKHCPNLKISVEGQRVNWLQVKWIQVRKEKPKSVFVNYSFNAENFMEIEVQNTKSRQKGRMHQWPKNEQDMKLCYETKHPVSVQKKMT